MRPSGAARLAATRPASIWRPSSQAHSSACRPYSPKETSSPRCATPFSVPRWTLRQRTRLGISAMFVLLLVHALVPALEDPALAADDAVARVGLREAVVDVRVE